MLFSMAIGWVFLAIGEWSTFVKELKGVDLDTDRHVACNSISGHSHSCHESFKTHAAAVRAWSDALQDRTIASPLGVRRQDLSGLAWVVTVGRETGVYENM
jgi:hypothetical protein